MPAGVGGQGASGELQKGNWSGAGQVATSSDRGRSELEVRKSAGNGSYCAEKCRLEGTKADGLIAGEDWSEGCIFMHCKDEVREEKIDNTEGE